jgi:hypothetical protein
MRQAIKYFQQVDTDFKLSQRSECCLLPSGRLTGVGSLNANFSEHSVPSSYPSMKMEQTECSETLVFKLQTPVNHPEESIKQGYTGLQDASRRYRNPARSLKRRQQSGDLAYSPDVLCVLLRGTDQKTCDDNGRQTKLKSLIKLYGLM